MLFLKQYDRPKAIIAKGEALTNNSDNPYAFDIGLIKKILNDSIGFKSSNKKIRSKKRVNNIATIGDK